MTEQEKNPADLIPGGMDGYNFKFSPGFTDSDWRQIKNYSELNENGDWTHEQRFPTTRTSIMFLLPERFKELNFGDDQWQRMKNTLEAIRSWEDVDMEDWDVLRLMSLDINPLNRLRFISLAIETKLLFPKKVLEIEPLIRDENTWKYFNKKKDYFASICESGGYHDWHAFTEPALYARLILSEHVSEHDINEKIFKTLKTALDNDREDGSWGSFAEKAMRLRLIFPERFGELDIDEKILDRLKGKFDKLRQGYWFESALDQAMAIRILEANEVIVSGQGIEIK